jgi:RNA polymerase sigma-70 factor (sigma-E family)
VTTISTEFTTFVAERQRPLLRFATALSGDPRQAEELVADALSKAWERWDRISAMEYPQAYVRKIVVNDFLSWHRRIRRTNTVAELADYADETSDHASAHAARAALIHRLGSLPRKQRATLLLRFDEDMSDEQIAELLGCSTATVRSNTSRALATLRIQLDASAPGTHARYRRPIAITSKGDL